MARLRIVGLILFLPLLFVSIAGAAVYWQLQAPVGKDLVFDIPRGDNLSSITTRLNGQAALPTDAFLFKAYALYTREEGAIQAGQYQLRSGMTTTDVLALFRSGRVIQYSITFPEGWTMHEWRQAMSEAPYLKLTGLADAELGDVLGIEGHPEGWFFPDTYNYVKGDSDAHLFFRAHQKMQAVLDAEWQGRANIPHLVSQRDALVLASVVEKETGYEPDRTKIASVFHNRLVGGMKLQSDPTVIYGIGNAFDGDLKRSHLRADTPYNTYTRKGLPTGAICSPGRSSIRAVVQGSSYPFLYFVAKGDGQSYFSMDLDEHNAAVNRYQRNRK